MSTTLNYITVSSLKLSADQMLIERIALGDEKAFTALHKRHYIDLVEIAKSVVKCPFVAEEVVSDVMIKIWHNRTLLSTTTNIKYYLKVATRNRGIDYIRKNQKRINSTQCIDHCNQLINLSCYFSDQLELEQLNDKIKTAIASLPPKAREVFILSRNEGLKYREIAEKLKLSIKTVETQMSRNLTHLRASLAEL
jgi:RNA polymerase sigma-70 factor, ECF subfamily